MKVSVLAAFLATATLASLPLVPAVQAGSGIQRCEGTGGAAIYTDKACVAFGAKAVPMSGELLVRLANETAHAPQGSLASSNVTAPAPAPGRRSVSVGCARTPTQLAMDLRGAFALGDVNRIAESYHWVGMSHDGAVAVMKRLEHLQRDTLVDTQYFDATIGSGFASYADASGGDADGGAGILQATFGDDGRVTSITDFEVRRHAGCYFVRF
jgi:hypothetical protein